MLVQVVLFDGFDPLDVVAPYEVLGAGGMTAGRGTARSAPGTARSAPGTARSAPGTVRSARGTVPVLESRPA
ncbi:hypothetical protein ACH492_03445 [Streptomyces sp. NPDC019443]|uniref:hypothetical protein n=1 Tax=Streptomyces sp. NPDC019443 TaxID=3365061 RepID=UPI0037AA94EA